MKEHSQNQETLGFPLQLLSGSTNVLLVQDMYKGIC